MTALTAVELFAPLPPADLRRLEHHARVRAYRRGDVVFTPGDRCASLFLIDVGRIKLSRTSREGREVAVHLLGAGEPFGEESLLEETRRGFTAQSLDVSEVREFPATLLQPYLDADLAFARALLRLTNRRRLELAVQVDDLAFKDTGARLASCLLSLAEHHGRRLPGEAVQIGMTVTHEELAHLIGSTRETVSLALEQFRKAGWIATRGRALILQDRPALKHRAIT